jgi:HD-GYP domain-containing protein (c-di-GMP phosphodiesterase class II)
MKVKRLQLQEGTILAADVLSISNQPIMVENTVLTKEHIEVLEAFMIETVEVKRRSVSNLLENEKHVIETPVEKKLDDDFLTLYTQAVKQFKKLFTNWQAGAAVDLYKVRTAIMPFLEKGVYHPRKLMSLHHFSDVNNYIYHHAVSVAALSAFLGKKLKFPKGEWIQIGIAGLLCDCGMAKIQPRLLEKKSAFSTREFHEVKQHAVVGYQMLKKLSGIKEGVLLGVLQHHEREDGSGYPLGSKGNQLHHYSRVIAVSDVFHAMTSQRIYKPKQSPFKVIEQMTKDEFGKFSPQVLNVLMNELAHLSVGTIVRLTNNNIGEVVFIEPQVPTRPMIKLKDSNEIVTLKNSHHIYIEEIL